VTCTCTATTADAASDKVTACNYGIVWGCTCHNSSRDVMVRCIRRREMRGRTILAAGKRGLQGKEIASLFARVHVSGASITCCAGAVVDCRSVQYCLRRIGEGRWGRTRAVLRMMLPV
jgi:hypothetical protein